jgi:hypothetical protein
MGEEPASPAGSAAACAADFRYLDFSQFRGTKEFREAESFYRRDSIFVKISQDSARPLLFGDLSGHLYAVFSASL